MERLEPLLWPRWSSDLPEYIAAFKFNRKLWLAGMTVTLATSVLALIVSLVLIEMLWKSTTGHQCPRVKETAQLITLFGFVLSTMVANLFVWLTAWQAPSSSWPTLEYTGIVFLANVALVKSVLTGPLSYGSDLHPDQVVNLDARFRVFHFTYLLGTEWTIGFQYAASGQDETMDYGAFLLRQRFRSTFDEISDALGKAVGRNLITADLDAISGRSC